MSVPKTNFEVADGLGIRSFKWKIISNFFLFKISKLNLKRASNRDVLMCICNFKYGI